MIKEIVHATLPQNSTKTLKSLTKNNGIRPDNKRRRTEETKETQNPLKESSQAMDNAETHEVKGKVNRRLHIPTLFSFLVFYVCVINVIITCDVSINDVNIKTYKGTPSTHVSHALIRDKIKRVHKHDVHSKNLRKSRAPQRETETEDKDKYSGPEAQELTKYYDYFKSREDHVNTTEFSNRFQPPRYVYDDSHAVGFPHDLASNPYYVKKTNFNLRPERHQFNKKIVKLGVLLPADPGQVFSLVKVLPILEMAVPAVTKPDGPLPGWKILVDYRDTGCSSVEGPLAAFEFYINGSAGKLQIRK